MPDSEEVKKFLEEARSSTGPSSLATGKSVSAKRGPLTEREKDLLADFNDHKRKVPLTGQVLPVRWHDD